MSRSGDSVAPNGGAVASLVACWARVYPSSSHTIGPMRITYDFYQRCTKLTPDQLAQATGLKVHQERPAVDGRWQQRHLGQWQEQIVILARYLHRPLLPFVSCRQSRLTDACPSTTGCIEVPYWRLPQACSSVYDGQAIDPNGVATFPALYFDLDQNPSS
jgi:hypothetical protein